MDAEPPATPPWVAPYTITDAGTAHWVRMTEPPAGQTKLLVVAELETPVPHEKNAVTVPELVMTRSLA
jgi:hypothetical protein